jgi:hypothetical protein
VIAVDDDESVAEGDRILDLGGDGTGRRLERRAVVLQRENSHERIVGVGRLAVHPKLVELIVCKNIVSVSILAQIRKHEGQEADASNCMHEKTTMTRLSRGGWLLKVS